MPTILTHPAVPIAIGACLGFAQIPPRLLVFGIFASILPDLDVLAFRFHIAYSHEFGHRGASHSLSFAFLVGLLAALLAPMLRSKAITAFLFAFLCAASHGLLDMLTNGGLGVALWWPWSNERLFFPCQVIQVSPLSLQRIFSPAGVAVFKSELLWVWLPALFSICFFRFIFFVFNKHVKPRPPA